MMDATAIIIIACPGHCAGATKRFFQSKIEEEALKGKGKYSEKVKRTRQRNRICRVSK